MFSKQQLDDLFAFSPNVLRVHLCAQAASLQNLSSRRFDAEKNMRTIDNAQNSNVSPTSSALLRFATFIQITISHSSSLTFSYSLHMDILWNNWHLWSFKIMYYEQTKMCLPKVAVENECARWIRLTRNLPIGMLPSSPPPFGILTPTSNQINYTRIKWLAGKARFLRLAIFLCAARALSMNEKWYAHKFSSVYSFRIRADMRARIRITHPIKTHFSA